MAIRYHNNRMRTRIDSIDWAAAIATDPLIAVPDGLTGRWWVAHTKPRNEKALARDLEILGLHYYLPMRAKMTRSRRTGRRSQSIIPVFPGYLFFNSDDDQRTAAQTTNRIAGTLIVADQEALVRELRQVQRLLSSGADFNWGPSISVGDWARVISGPLLGLEGIVQKRLTRMRLVLNVNMLSQAVSIEVPQDCIEKIAPPDFRSI